MGFWRRFAFGLQKWMYGRYGSDTLNIAILITYAVLYIVAQIFWLPLLAWLSMGLLLWSFFRMFSRNIAARSRETRAFCSFFQRLAAPFRRSARSIKDRQHRYYSCPKCRNTLRVPKGKGKLEITCPVCGNRFVRKS